MISGCDDLVNCYNRVLNNVPGIHFTNGNGKLRTDDDIRKYLHWFRL